MEKFIDPLNVVEIATSKVEYLIPPNERTIAKLVKQYVKTRKKPLVIDGIIIGKSILKNFCNLLAPSILTVSSIF
ncbi:hypothetical protein OSSY52_21920 [Tepiditoga spiralis]|uniref:Uncharacterized protein n=1 Tax=Tepiditoga spiralis TaxID=2108365 RepID=A0A7G1G6I3_9BACT|nr:hypothetical protein OSSY52_21920 [Tepiditoga spiralis]